MEPGERSAHGSPDLRLSALRMDLPTAREAGGALCAWISRTSLQWSRQNSLRTESPNYSGTDGTLCAWISRVLTSPGAYGKSCVWIPSHYTHAEVIATTALYVPMPSKQKGGTPPNLQPTLADLRKSCGAVLEHHREIETDLPAVRDTAGRTRTRALRVPCTTHPERPQPGRASPY